jgi:hypothetical protein
VETGTAWACLLPGSLLFYFCPLILRVVLLVFPLVSAAIDDENYLKFKWLCDYSTTGQGHQRILFLSEWRGFALRTASWGKSGSDADTGKLTRRNDLIESLIESRSFPDFPAGDTVATHWLLVA